MAFDRKLLKKIMPMPRFIPMHDQWIGLMGEIYGKVKFIDMPLIYYRVHGGNVTGGETTFKQKMKWRRYLIDKLVKNSIELENLTKKQIQTLKAVNNETGKAIQGIGYTFDEKRVRGWIDKNRERYQIFGFGLWAVCLKETGEMIGDCGLTMQLINGQIKPEIGYHIRADKQRKGYAKEAAIAVRDWTFNNTPFNIVYSYMKYTNEASAKTAMSYGCKQVDNFFDEVNGITKVFAISRNEWINR